MITETTNKDLAAQRAYVSKMQQAEFDFGLMVAEAFVRGIRDIGYRSTATALDELIDNAVQADATNVHVAFGFGPKSDAKPVAMAVLDDGHGMDPAMIRLAMTWGGTHREGNREGMGRYGYGLPSAAVSQGKAFSVYSRTTDEGAFQKVTLDVTALGQGAYNNEHGKVVMPAPVDAQLPAWVESYAKKYYGGKRQPVRTVVLIEQLDRLSWKTATALETNLLKQFGLTYRNYLRLVDIYVNDKLVEPVDPLFLTPGAKYYDLDDDRAVALDPLTFEVKDPDRREVVGTVKVRFSYMPPTFQRVDKTKERGRTNKRFEVMRENNGIIILRHGRQIDVATKCPWTTFTIYDRNWGVEVDFPPTLDEEFSVTTSKQQIVLSDRMWELLYQQGVWTAIKELRKRFKTENSALRTKRKEDAKRASEQAMEEAERFKVRQTPETEDRTKRQKEAFDKEVQRRSKDSGVPPEIVRERLEAETRDQRYRVEEDAMRGGPFYWMEQRGAQKVLVLNTAHRFFTDVYGALDTTPRLQAALETMLFVLGDAELDASGDRELFYKTERSHWSMQLEVALAQLDNWVPAEEEDEEDVAEEEASAIVG